MIYKRKTGEARRTSLPVTRECLLYFKELIDVWSYYYFVLERQNLEPDSVKKFIRLVDNHIGEFKFDKTRKCYSQIDISSYTRWRTSSDWYLNQIV